MAILYIGDFCALKSSPSITGRILKSSEPLNLNTTLFVHEDFPEHLKLQIQQTELPPRGYVVLQITIPIYAELLVSEAEVILRDRLFRKGEDVKKNPSDAQSDLSSRSQLTHFDILHPSPVVNVDMHDLAASQIWNKGETIIYNDWVGVVRDVFNELTVKFDDGKVMSFQDQEGVVQSIPTSTDSIANYERFDCNPQEVPMDNYHVLTRPRHIGQRIWITKEVFSGSRYLMGFNPEGSFTGLIVHIWCKTMKVDWEFPSVKVSHNDRFIKPPLILISALLESGAVRLYDSSRRPQENDNVAGAPYIGLIPQYVYPSSYVIFKANQKAVDKYGEQMFGHWMSSVLSTPSTTINISERMAIVSEITSTTSWVRVQWQDGSITDECSTSVYPYAETDDHDVWPGELVSLKDQEYTFQDPPFGEMIETCAVGVVQSVNASERTAFVRWYDGVDITITGEEQDEIIRTYSTLGQITGKVTEVSSLELAVHQALNKRVGDIVRISRPDLIPRELANQSSDWYREVIHVSLDGRVSVRLGGLSSVCDITCSILDVAASTDDDTAETIETDTDVIWDRMTRRQTLQTNTDLDASVLSRSDPSHENQQMTENSSDGRSNIESLGQQRNIASAMNAKKRPNNHIDVEAPADTSTLERAKRRQIQSECADPSYRICSAPVSFEILDGMGPFINGLGDKSGKWVQAVFREYRILRKSLPEGVYVRSWNASINMIRVLIVGPSDTPYAYAPFLFDIHLEEKFPNRPPRIFFHSWTRGIGKINPNLYQDGKVCLNLLGTWHSQEDDEGWVPGKSSILQIIVSLLGLVLVKEPYYNEAGYEALRGTVQAKIPAALYSEKAFVLSRQFVVEAVRTPPAGFADVVQWLYLPSANGPSMLKSIIEDCRIFLQETASSGSEEILPRQKEQLEKYHITSEKISQGVLVLLKKTMADFESLGSL